jgi:hypothetical protein
MSAQSFHAQVSNAMTAAVNQENERSPISKSAAFDGGKRERSTAKKRLLQTAFFLKAVFVFDRCGRRPQWFARCRQVVQGRVKGLASRGRHA